MAGRNAQKADVILKDFWRQNERFADLFNAVIFRGKQVIKPEDLTERDTDMSGIIQFKDYRKTLERTRDVVKKMAYGVEFAVLGIESQQKIHYAMPLRTMLYDSLGYLKEYQEITRIRKAERGKMTEDEFLSKMRKEDRLHPIISIVLYYSEKSGTAMLVDDYGHHPTEVDATIKAARAGWPDKNLVMLFQPHRFTRTRDLYDDFANVLTQVDTLLMLEVYPAGEAPIPGADSRSLCRTIRGRGKIDPILVPDPAQVAEMLAPVLTGNDLILVQGAGNIGKIARSLAEIKLKPQTPEEEQHD